MVWSLLAELPREVLLTAGEKQEALRRDLGTLKHGAIINGVKFNEGKRCLDAFWFRCLEPGAG